MGHYGSECRKQKNEFNQRQNNNKIEKVKKQWRPKNKQVIDFDTCSHGAENNECATSEHIIDSINISNENCNNLSGTHKIMMSGRFQVLETIAEEFKEDLNSLEIFPNIATQKVNSEKGESS